MSTLATVHARGTLVARPAAGNAGRLYYVTDSTPGWYRDNGSSWDASDGGGGAAGAANEEAAGILVNATSAGDAGGRADHFPGTSLDAAWVTEATAVSVGPTVKNSVATWVGPATANANHRLRAYTPSGAFRVEARMRGIGVSGRGFGLLVRDSGTGDATGEGMLFDISTAVGNVVAYSLDAGTYTSRATNAALNWAAGTFWVYLAVERDGANAWTCRVSVDRTDWITVLSAHAKTFTVAKVGFRTYQDMRASVDFFDVVS